MALAAIRQVLRGRRRPDCAPQAWLAVEARLAGGAVSKADSPSRPHAMTMSWFQAKNGRASGARRFIQRLVVVTFQS